jgi:hypothetical protein
MTIVVLVAVVVALYLRSCGAAVGEIEMDETPREVHFDLVEPSQIGFATSFELPDSRFASREELPHALDYEIEVVRAGQRVALLVCNPFDMWVRRSGKSGQKVSFLSGKLNRCNASLTAPASYAVRARRVWSDARRPIQLTENTLTIELER